MVKTFRKGFLAVVLAFVALFALASCVLPTPTPTPTPNSKFRHYNFVLFNKNRSK
mgnify:CR=1 FL=1